MKINMHSKRRSKLFVRIHDLLKSFKLFYLLLCVLHFILFQLVVWVNVSFVAVAFGTFL